MYAAPEEHISEGDVNRLFGRFTWNPLSPAGNLERNGFFWRQLRRRRQRDGWTVAGYVLFAIFAVPFVLGLIWALVSIVENILR